jgi:hypothetical protein
MMKPTANFQGMGDWRHFFYYIIVAPETLYFTSNTSSVLKEMFLVFFFNLEKHANKKKYPKYT